MTSVAKHTPGPWQDDRGFRDVFSPASGHYTVADDYMTVFCGETAIDDFDPDTHDYVQVWGPRQEANAHLIAAAPDMLAALERAAIRMENAAKVYRDEPDHTQWREWATEVRAAIAKATQD